jgi:hypothetical protein
MTVAQLIAKLQKLDQKLPVRAYSHHTRLEFDKLDSVGEAMCFHKTDKPGVILHFDADHI